MNITDNNVVEDIRIVFSNNAFQFNSNKPMEAKEFSVRLSAEEAYISGNHIIDGKSFMVFDIFKGLESHLGIWDKINNRTHLVSYLKNDMDGLIPKIPGIFPFNSNSSHFITMIYPDYLNEKKQDGFPEGKYKKTLEGIKVDDIDNPILFIYKFKDKI